MRSNNPAASATPGGRDRLAARFSSEGHGALKGVKVEGDMEQIRRNREIFGSTTHCSRYKSLARFKSRAFWQSAGFPGKICFDLRRRSS